MPKERFEGDTNCIGYALFKLGQLPEEKYVQPHYLNVLGLEVVEMEQAPAVGAIIPGNNGLVHLAIINPRDRKTIIHRPGWLNAEVEETTLEEGFRFYRGGETFQVVGLKVRAK